MVNGFRKKHSCEAQLLITTHDLAVIMNNHSQVDAAVLDFAKAFDKVPHRRLLVKLKHYNLIQQVIGWIKSFLSSRTQRVVVDGYISQEAPVLSGVPQGTVLGPLLFLIFINDITENVSSPIRLFADDCLIYHGIWSPSDCNLLSKDLDTIVKWSKTWGMMFNIKKCNIISITNATKNKIHHQYTMDNEPLNSIDTCLSGSHSEQ